MAEITIESFIKTLDSLVNANPHARSKGDLFKSWCEENFGQKARISYVKSQQQTTNRVSEQFRYFDPIVVFACNPDVKRDSIQGYILERGYRQLENVAIVGVTIDEQSKISYEFEKLLVFKNSAFTEWAKSFFKEIQTASSEDTSEDNAIDDQIESADSIGDESGASNKQYANEVEDLILNSLQVIVYGTPGSGKSFKVNDTLAQNAKVPAIPISYIDYLRKYTKVQSPGVQQSYNNIITKSTYWNKIKANITLSGTYNTISDIQAPEEVQKIVDYLKNDPSGIQVNATTQHNAFSASCDRYIEYLNYLSSGGSDRIIKRTIFHPDTDFSSFVGAYKPIKDKTTLKITYDYTPQVFTDAYVDAWLNPDMKVYLIIEEINRGNCAQIFGSLFQLLDRKDGYSEYPVSPDKDLKSYLFDRFNSASASLDESKWGYSRVSEVKSAEIMAIPNNLHLIATMNTSDQSLFPMDSAFKRRWDWLYIPIDYTEPKSTKFRIIIGPKDNPALCHSYEWLKFLKAINERIYAATSSEDKQMGNFFVKGNIYATEFINKVMFYLWTEICKDEGRSNNNFFFINEGGKKRWFTFNQLFPISESYGLLQAFIERILSEDKSQTEE